MIFRLVKKCQLRFVLWFAYGKKKWPARLKKGGGKFSEVVTSRKSAYWIGKEGV